MKLLIYCLFGMLLVSATLVMLQPLIKSTKLHVYTEITIDSSVEEVWGVLAATENYPKWNPYHKNIVGKKEVGARMRIEVQKPNGEHLIIKPRYMVIAPLKELTWGGGVPRIFFGEHVFKLQSISDSQTLLIQEETFSGLAIPFVRLEAIEEGYNQCNRAIKEYLEQGWTVTAEDQVKIKSLATDIPLILANQGWEPYVSSFDAGYTNWSMTGDKIRSRSDYLGLVKQWYEDGNRATASEVEDVAFIPISDDLVIYLNVQKEAFANGEDENIAFREMSFVSIYKRYDDAWKLYFTAFMDRPNK